MLDSPRDFVRLKYVGVFFLGLLICLIGHRYFAMLAWVMGWAYGMEWQREKTPLAPAEPN